MPKYYKHETAIVDEPCTIGEGTKIWHFCHIMSDACIGKDCILGQNVHIAGGVSIGNGVKIQNNVSVYAGVRIEDFVFLGPSCVFTNVLNPRSEINRHSQFEETLVKYGASIGANATILCGISIGKYALVGAGSVVTRDVPDFALVVGIPARQRGWVSRHGCRLTSPDAHRVYICPESGLRYQETEDNELRCIDFCENS